MAGSWLYCIAAAAGKVFDFEGKSKPIPVNTATYATLVETGRIVEDPWWYITRNWKNAAPGDEVFIYTGHKDLGIIGYATIEQVAERSTGWCLRLKFDLPRCSALLDSPIPATVVRQWIPFPRGNVLNLAAFDSELSSRLPWRIRPKTVRKG